MKIAIVRGPFLNKWEMQNYEPLRERHQMQAFTTFGHFFPLEEIKIPVHKLISTDTIPAMISPRLARLFNSATSLMFGSSYYMLGLEDKLKGMDVVHSAETYHTFTAQVIAAKKKYGFKVLITVWENIPFRGESRRAKIKEEARKNADLFIVPTARSRDCLITEGVKEEKIKVIPMGVDRERFKPEKKNKTILKKLGLKEDDFIILFTGRLSREKGVYELLYAIKKMSLDKEIKVPLVFLFVGEGPERKRILKLIKRLGIGNLIKLTGSFPYEQMACLHNLADIFVLPSIPTPKWQEQFGMSLVESMACAKPVISTTTGSIPEVVGKAGILIPPADYLILYLRLKQLIQSPEERQRMAELAYEHSRQFDAQKISLLLNECY